MKEKKEKPVKEKKEKPVKEKKEKPVKEKKEKPVKPVKEKKEKPVKEKKEKKEKPSETSSTPTPSINQEKFVYTGDSSKIPHWFIGKGRKPPKDGKYKVNMERAYNNATKAVEGLRKLKNPEQEYNSVSYLIKRGMLRNPSDTLKYIELLQSME